MNIAFIVGCPRSGTSILGELIASHPEVEYLFEAAYWLKDLKGTMEAHSLTEEDATPHAINLLHDWYKKRMNGKKVFVHKYPGLILSVLFIRKIFPDAKMIHIVRDGRDVACSLMPIFDNIRKNEEWIDGRFFKTQNWQDIIKHHRGVMRCVYVWKEIMEVGLEDLDNIPHLQLKYENLISGPKETAIKILDYLELPHHPNTLAFCDKIQNKFDGSYHADKQNGWYSEKYPHKVRVGRFRENLNEEEQKKATQTLGPLLKRLEYKI